MNFSENLQKARKKAGISQKELAERLQVYQKDISRWERGERTPSVEVFTRMCKELGASADEILELNIQKRRGRKNEKEII